MKRRHGRYLYETKFVEDTKDGFAAVELFQELDGDRRLAAKVVFWDAEGQFSLETCGTDVPLVIVEELIAAAKATIKRR